MAKYLSSISKIRLAGEALPADLKLLLKHAQYLNDTMEVSFGSDAQWAPWSDTSYLTEADLRDPEIGANVAASADVIKHIAFVAELPDQTYIGYWRGPKQRPVAQSPLVVLDSEGQFYLCSGRTLSEALLDRTYDDENFEEVHSWMESIGIELEIASRDELVIPDEPDDPAQLHKARYEHFRSETAPKAS